MAFAFSAGQRQQLITAIASAQTAFDAHQSGTGIFSAVYDLLLGFISAEVQLEVGTTSIPAEGVDDAVWTWIGGAQDVNENTGGFASFIRDYTAFQYQMRYGTAMSGATLQFASNRVSMNFFEDLLTIFDGIPENWSLPTLRQVGEDDAGAAAAVVFNTDVSPWSGNLLFPYLGDDSFFRTNLIGVGGSTYDLLSALVAGHDAAISNAFGLALEWLQGRMPAADPSYLTAEATAYFKSSYGLGTEYAYSPGDDLIFNPVGSAFPDQEYVLGTLGNDTLAFDGFDSIIHAGTGDDIVQVEVSTVGDYHRSVIDGGEGNDLLDLSAVVVPAGTSLHTTLEAVSGTLYGQRYAVSLPNAFGSNIAWTYGFESLILTADDDIVGFAGDASGLDLEGLWLEGGEGGPHGDTLDFSALNAPTGISADLETQIAGIGPTVTAETGMAVTGFENAIGTSGNDIISGSTTLNHLIGGGGNDTLEGGTGADVLNGGSGTDWARYLESASGVIVSLVTGTGQGGEAEGDTLTGIERVDGSEFADTITGAAGVNWLRGRGGADILKGGTGNDVLFGGTDADIFKFGSTDGHDEIRDFEDGLDLIDFSATGLSFASLTIAANASGNAVVSISSAHDITIWNAAGLIGAEDFIFAVA